MSKNLVKLIIWFILIAFSLLALYGIITGLGQLITYFNTGADPRSALNLIPVAPPDLDRRLEWQPDEWQAGRPLEPFNRDRIAGAYLNAWAQWNISYEVGEPYGLKTYFSGYALDGVSTAVAETVGQGWEVGQSDLAHHPRLTFYSDDGLAVAFTDEDVPLVQHLTHPATGREQVIETRATFDVVMVQEQGNWRVRFWQRRPNPEKSMQVQAPLQSASLVTVENNSLTFNGRPYAVAGINYYPQATPWQDFWPNYDPQIVAADMTQMQSLGLNTVVIFIPFAQFGGDEPDQIYLTHLADFLHQAQQHNLKVIVTLFDHHTDYSLPNWSADDRHLAHLVPHVAGHPALLAWNLKNEPDRDYDSNSPELVDAWLRHVAATVRSLDNDHPITIGWSIPAAARALTDVVDVVSYHYYAPAADYPRQLAELRRAVPADKPLLLLEFGLPTWNTIFPNGHTEAEQTAYYADILSIQRLSHIAGYAAWTLHDFDTTLAEFKFPWQRGPQMNMGVVRRDGTLKPAASLLYPQAELTKVSSVPGWHRFTKPFWLLVMVMALISFAVGLILWLKRRHWLTSQLTRWWSTQPRFGATLRRYLSWQIAGRVLAQRRRQRRTRRQSTSPSPVALNPAPPAAETPATGEFLPDDDELRETILADVRELMTTELRQIIAQELQSAKVETPPPDKKKSKRGKKKKKKSKK